MHRESTGQGDQLQETRIGVFVCHCGSNIAGFLDCSAVTQYALTLPGVVFAVENLYTCSEAGIAEIQKAIKEHNVNRVVVASCSPRTHQPLFQNACAEAGLNPYLFEMVNIRDQCSWVHMQEREAATKKAKDLVRMGAAKAAFLEPQQDLEIPLIPRALVIGGGLSGLSAAEAMADMGLEVIIVEKRRQLGGLLRKINRLAPGGDKAIDRIQALIEKVTAKSNVTTYLSSQAVNVGGYVGNFEVTIQPPEGETFIEKVGCILVATGAGPFNPTGLYGYDGKTIITQMELEERLGQGEFTARRVAMIQCVGGRSAEWEYCSRICCMTAVKNALSIKELNPEAQVHILYRDMQMYGTEKEQMLWEARGQGVGFHVYQADKPPVVENGIVRFYHALMNETREVPYDLVVLSTPLVPPEDALLLSQILKVPLDHNGFFAEAHVKLRPLDFATDGIFVCGSAHYPATVEEAQSQGLGAAARIATILFKDKLSISSIVAEINAEACVGCQACLDICPYGAISYLMEPNICEVNTVLCKGCGSCAATCPSQSAQLKGFKPQQLFAQIKAMESDEPLHG